MINGYDTQRRTTAPPHCRAAAPPRRRTTSHPPAAPHLAAPHRAAAARSSGESLPVGFPGLLTQLQGKLKQAEVWVERVRSAVPRQNRTRNKADMEKVEFGTMKNLLNEVLPTSPTTLPPPSPTPLPPIPAPQHPCPPPPPLLLNTPTTTPAPPSSPPLPRHHHHPCPTITTTTPPQVTTMNVDMKERNEMEQVVETAEDWISRVRGAFTAGESATLTNLESLLTEADDIPVNMDEHQLLIGEIKARRWCTKVKELLDSKTAKIEVLVKLLDEFEAIRAAMPLEPRAKKAWWVTAGQHDPSPLALATLLVLTTLRESPAPWGSHPRHARHTNRPRDARDAHHAHQAHEAHQAHHALALTPHQLTHYPKARAGGDRGEAHRGGGRVVEEQSEAGDRCEEGHDRTQVQIAGGRGR